MSIKVKVGATVQDFSGDFRTIEITGKHFSDYSVVIREDVCDEDGNEIGEKLTDAIFTQQEIDSLFGNGSHVTLVSRYSVRPEFYAEWAADENTVIDDDDVAAKADETGESMSDLYDQLEEIF